MGEARGLVVVKGGGDLASGVIYRLWRVGFPVVVTEIAQPTVVRRAVAFAQAVYDGETTVEGLTARRVSHAGQALAALQEGIIPVLVNPQAQVVRELSPQVVVDAIMAKRNLGTRITDAPLVVALGPGFVAGVDAHAVIETKRGHHLGRVILRGAVEPDTAVPADVRGYTQERVLRAPADGTVKAYKNIGDPLLAGEVVAEVGSCAVSAPFSGVLRGLIQEGVWVRKGIKIGDVDPRGMREYCFTISDRALAVAGGVLEAVFYLLRTPGSLRAMV